MRLKERLNTEKNESKACVASAQRVSDQSNEVYQQLMEARAKLVQLTKQKETNDKCLHNKIARLQQQNDKLLDRLRNKSGNESAAYYLRKKRLNLIQKVFNGSPLGKDVVNLILKLL